MTPFKVGLLGAGYIVQAHARALATLDAVEMTAVCDVSKERATAKSPSPPSASLASSRRSTKTLIASDCDVVHVLLPPFLHEAVARRLLEAGKSVHRKCRWDWSAADCKALAELAVAARPAPGGQHPYNFLFMPGYEAMRRDAASGALGTLDHLNVNWLYALGLIQFGPYNNWILGSEGNLLYELGRISLLCHGSARPARRGGSGRVAADRAARPSACLSALECHRPEWQHLGEPGEPVGRSGAAWTLSVHLRGSAAVARLDFERDLYWRERANSNSAMFDPLHTARSMSRTIAGQGWRNVGRQLASTFARTPYNGAFQASISNSVAAYYRTFAEGLDPRLQGSFGAGDPPVRAHRRRRRCRSGVAAEADPLP